MPARYLAIATAMVVYVVIDSLTVPFWSRMSLQPFLLPAAIAQALTHSVVYLAPAWLPAVAAVWARNRQPAPDDSALSRRHLLHWILGGLAAALAQHAMLFDEPALRSHPLLLATTGLWALTLAASHACLPGGLGRKLLPARAGSALERYPISIAGLYAVAGITVHVGHARIYPGLYPGFHAYACQISASLLIVATQHVARAPWPGILLGLRSHASALTRAQLWVATLVASLVVSTPLFDGAKPAFKADTSIGRIGVLFTDPPSAVWEARESELGEPPIERFRAHAGLPSLPADFQPENFNLLFIAIEALRYDQTNIGDPDLATTPALMRFIADTGAFVHHRAYAPSSGTLHSMGAVMAMATPSTAPIETWKKNWHGKLEYEATTVAETYALAGHDTFWVGHNFKHAFTQKLLGLGQGIAHADLLYTAPGERHKDTDTAIAQRAVAAIDAQVKAGKDRNFFGWIMLVSPHADYRSHNDDQPANSALLRYRQEIRFADAALGSILQRLEHHKLLDNTIVVITGDHGEEFREHGGRFHKSTVYTEVTHVPLIVHIPGVKGIDLRHPTSVAYLFPWLASYGHGARARIAGQQIETIFAPFMAATDGGVPIELIGRRRMQTSLVYPDYKLNYDFHADRIQLFDLRDDPGEQVDIYGVDEALSRIFRRRLDGYLHERSARKRFVLAPEKREATAEDLRANTMQLRLSNR